MNKQTQSYLRQLNKKERLMIITALSGEFPYDSFFRLGVDASYARLLRTILYKENQLQPKWKDGLKGVTATAKAFKKMRELYPVRYKYVDDKSRSEISRRYRNQIFALTFCSLINADIEFLPDKKPYVFTRSRQTQSYNVPRPIINNSILTTEPIFYSSRELKYELEDFVQQIRTSAMMGLIMTGADCYILYNIHENRYPLSYATEHKASILTRNGEIIQLRQDKAAQAIILVSDFTVGAEIVIGNKKKKIRASRIIEDEPFAHLYLIPETEEGDTQLYVLCHQEYRDMVDDTLANNYDKPNNNFCIINDGIDSNGRPVLNGCHLDIMRLMKFKRGLLVNELTGCILCYDFQMGFIEKIMQPAKIVINHIKIQDVKEVIDG